MKLIRRKDEATPSLLSEGKLLEVIPIVADGTGQPFMLPPVVWRVPNWLLGYEDWHTVHMPVTMYQGERYYIPGSNSARSHSLSFMIRILEDSPNVGITVATVDMEAVQALADVIKEGMKDGYGRNPTR